MRSRLLHGAVRHAYEHGGVSERAAMSLFPRPSAARDGGRRAHRDVLAACLGKRLIAARILAMRLNATLSCCATRSAAGFADADALDDAASRRRERKRGGPKAPVACRRAAGTRATRSAART